MTRTQTIDALGLLLATGLIGAPDPKVLRLTVEVYQDALGHLDADKVAKAIRAYITDTTPSSATDARPVGQWWPTPAVLLQRVEALDEADRLASWAKVCAIRTAEDAAALQPAERAALAVIGGVAHVRNRSTTEDASLRRAYIRALYEAHRVGALVRT